MGVCFWGMGSYQNEFGQPTPIEIFTPSVENFKEHVPQWEYESEIVATPFEIITPPVRGFWKHLPWWESES